MRLRSAILAAAFLSIAFLSIAAASAHAADCNLEGNTQQMLACVKQDLAREDKRLNDAYRKLTTALKEDEKATNLLRDAQRKWIAFRDAHCAFEADEMRGGTLEPVFMTDCLAVRTAERAKFLEELVQRGR